MKNMLKNTMLATVIMSTQVFSASAFTTIDVNKKLFNSFTTWQTKLVEANEQKANATQAIKISSSIAQQKDVDLGLTEMESKSLQRTAGIVQAKYIQDSINSLKNYKAELERAHGALEPISREAIRELYNRKEVNLSLQEFNRKLRNIGKNYTDALAQDLSKSEANDIKIASKLAGVNEKINALFKDVGLGDTYEKQIILSGERLKLNILATANIIKQREHLLYILNNRAAKYYSTFDIGGMEDQIEMNLSIAEDIAFSIFDEADNTTSSYKGADDNIWNGQ